MPNVILIPGGSSSGPVVAGAIQPQFLPIGGIGETRCITIANDGTMLAWNDSTGAWISNTAIIPGNGPGNYQWQALLTAQNAPSSWLQAPTPYLCWQGSTYYVASTPANSSLIYMMYNLYQGSTWSGVLFKSTDKGNTFTLTNYPANANNGNAATAGQDPGQASTTIVIDPNANNIVWASDGFQLRVTLDGGSTWTSVNPAGGSGNAGYAMCYDAVTANRLIVGINGSGVYVSTNANLGASATWTLIAGSTTSPGVGLMGSDGTYYITNTGTSAGFTTVSRLSTGNVLTTIYNAGTCFAMGIDPNNPARLFLTPANNGGVIMNTTAANTTVPSWTASPGINYTNVDSPAVDTFGAIIGGLHVALDPWTTTSSTTINLSGLGAGGSTGNITVPAGIANITVGRQLRCTNTGTSTNYFIFTATSYSGTTLQGTIIGTAQGGFLGGPIGGTGSFSLWTISAERAYLAFDGVTYIEGFSSSTQNIFACKFGIEGSGLQNIIWPVGGNPAMTAQDRPVFQVQVNPWGLTGATGGAVKGYSPAAGPLQSSFLNVSISDPTFWISNSWANTWFSSGSAKVGTFTKYTNQPTAGNGGSVAISIPNIAIVADGSGNLFYSQNAASLGATWTIMPSPAPTSGWTFGAPFNGATTACADRTTVTSPYILYALNADGHIYKMSVPTSTTPTVTQKSQIGTTTLIAQSKLDSVIGHAGHLFYCPGATTPANSYATLFSDSPIGGQTRLAFSPDEGTTWTFLTSTQEVVMFAVNGAVVPGGSGYPTIYAAGWCGGGTYGIYQCINFNPASLGSETWTKVATYGGAFNLGLPISMAADPNQYNRFITGTQGSGAAIFESPNLTNSWYP